MSARRGRNGGGHAIGILAAGLVSSLGLELARHVQMLDAGRVGGRVGRARGVGQTHLHFVPEGALPPPAKAKGVATDAAQARLVARWLQLADLPLREAVGGCVAPPPLFVAVGAVNAPHDAAALPPAFLGALHAQVEGAFARDASAAFVGGTQAFFVALRHAAHHVVTRRQMVLVGAVDSMAPSAALPRLQRAAARDGFGPGEGAAFLLLGPVDAYAPAGPWAVLQGLGLGHEAEAGPTAPKRATGLTKALAAVLGPQPAVGAPVRTVVPMAGHQGAAAKEWSLAALRHHAALAADASFVDEASAYGDAGAAAPALALAASAYRLHQGRLQGPLLSYLVGDAPERAAVLLQGGQAAAGEPGPVQAAGAGDALTRAQRPQAAAAWYVRSADDAVDELAGLYGRWRSGLRDARPWPEPREALEGRLQNAAAQLGAEPLAAVALRRAGPLHDPATTYAAVRWALARGERRALGQILGRLRPNRRRHLAAAADALTHGWPGAHPELVDALVATTPGLALLACVAGRLGLVALQAPLQAAAARAAGARPAVLRALAELAGPNDVGTLRMQLQIARPSLRRANAAALLRLGEGAAALHALRDTPLAPFLSALTAAQNEGPRVLAAVQAAEAPAAWLALGLFGAVAHVPALLAALDEPSCRPHAALALRLMTGLGPMASAAWRQWWTTHGQGALPGPRCRWGQAHAPSAALAVLACPDLPARARHWVARELAAHTGAWCPWAPQLLRAQSDDSIRRQLQGHAPGGTAHESHGERVQR